MPKLLIVMKYHLNECAVNKLVIWGKGMIEEGIKGPREVCCHFHVNNVDFYVILKRILENLKTAWLKHIFLSSMRPQKYQITVLVLILLRQFYYQIHKSSLNLAHLYNFQE